MAKTLFALNKATSQVAHVCSFFFLFFFFWGTIKEQEKAIVTLISSMSNLALNFTFLVPLYKQTINEEKSYYNSPSNKMIAGLDKGI